MDSYSLIRRPATKEGSSWPLENNFSMEKLDLHLTLVHVTAWLTQHKDWLHIFQIPTGDLHGERVAADADEVEGHALHRHPLSGRPHGEDALHLHGAVLLPLDLHGGRLERDRQLQPRGVFIAPASLKHIFRQTEATDTTDSTPNLLSLPVQGYSRRPYPKTFVPDDSGRGVTIWSASECGYIFPSHHSNRSLCRRRKIREKFIFSFAKLGDSSIRLWRFFNGLSTNCKKHVFTSSITYDTFGLGTWRMHWPTRSWRKRCTGPAPVRSFSSAAELHGICEKKKKKINWEKEECLQNQKWHILRFEFRHFPCIISEYVDILKGEHNSSLCKQFHDLRKHSDLGVPWQIHRKMPRQHFFRVASPSCSTPDCFLTFTLCKHVRQQLSHTLVCTAPARPRCRTCYCIGWTCAPVWTCWETLACSTFALWCEDTPRWARWAPDLLPRSPPPRDPDGTV